MNQHPYEIRVVRLAFHQKAWSDENPRSYSCMQGHYFTGTDIHDCKAKAKVKLTGEPLAYIVFRNPNGRCYHQDPVNSEYEAF